MAKRARRRAETPLDMEETKAHVLAAGRELMLAAQGALAFCRDYAKSQTPAPQRSQLLGFFSKAIEVADELGKGLTTASHIPGAAKGMAGQIFDAMGREMNEQAREKRKARAKDKVKAEVKVERKGKRKVRAGRRK